MTTDQELLEYAAKAAGFTQHKYCEPWQCMAKYTLSEGYFGPSWNPLIDDGDALRLAVTLDLKVHGVGAAVCIHWKGGTTHERYGKDRYAATRKAIVRAAAIIGGMKP